MLQEPRNVDRLCYDSNPYVIEYYQLIKDDPEHFWDELNGYLDCLYNTPCLTYSSSEEDWGRINFESWKLAMNSGGSTPVLFYLITKLSMNGIFRLNKAGMVNSSYCKTIRGRGLFNREWFDRVVEQVQNCQFKNMDYMDSLCEILIDAPNDAFVFLDPPYREKAIENKKGCVTRYNGKKFTDEDHKELSKFAGFMKQRFLLTINDDDYIRDLYRGFHIVEHEPTYTCSQTPSGRGKRPELIIANYPIEDKFNQIKIELDGIKSRSKRVPKKSDPLQSPGELA